MGHLILSAAKTEIVSQMHMPVWKDQNLMSKSSWTGSLESMQYFATVIPEDSTDQVNEDTILWLPKDKIEDMDNEKRITDDLPELVGSGQSVGGVISEVCIEILINSERPKPRPKRFLDNFLRHFE